MDGATSKRGNFPTFHSHYLYTKRSNTGLACSNCRQWNCGRLVDRHSAMLHTSAQHAGVCSVIGGQYVEWWFWTNKCVAVALKDPLSTS